MKCPYCGSYQNTVIDSRPVGDYRRRRRYECRDCKKRFTSYESVYVIDIDRMRKDHQDMKDAINKIRQISSIIDNMDDQSGTTTIMYAN